MICPVCRSQNMETAKFCGNCGSPFPRSSTPSSSLINCAQGHVYSAVYEHCPYCPQPDRPLASADFATRIETAAEQVETSAETKVEPPPTSAQSQAPARTEKMRRDYATLIDPGTGPGAGNATQTDPITDAPTMDNYTVPTTDTQSAPTRPAGRSVGVPPEVSSGKKAAKERTNPVPGSQSATPPAGAPSTQARSQAPSAPEKGATPRTDRRTLVVPLEETPQLAPQGKLVGWIVTFGRNPDGDDYRLRAGRNVIGANPSCDIVVEDEAVSGVHASIVYRSGRCFIKDELSSNGTFINGVELDEVRALESYDEIRIGNTVMTFVALERAA